MKGGSGDSSQRCSDLKFCLLLTVLLGIKEEKNFQTWSPKINVKWNGGDSSMLYIITSSLLTVELPSSGSFSNTTF